jgi:hypothetical protein
MGLLTETNEQYYAGQQTFVQPNPVTTQTFTWTGDTQLVATTITTNTNFAVYKNGGLLNVTVDYNVVGNAITLIGGAISAPADVIQIRILEPALYENYGSYEYISLNDVINNFIVAYVGTGKLIPSVKRTDVMFHAKRGLQEFSYDTLKSIKSQELTIPPSLSVIIPQDYVNYVKTSWVDQLGVKHVIYPTRLTSNPTEIPIQDSDGVPTQDNVGNNAQGSSVTEEAWDNANMRRITGGYDDYLDVSVDSYRYDRIGLGKRYGLNPETTQVNGFYTINEREGKFSFSSDLVGKTVILEYISDGLSVDKDMKVPKMAEEAMYMHIAYSILAGRSGVQEYVVQRFKKDRRAALRNAKIRLSNIKLEEIAQVFRNQSKIIKH